MRNEINKERLGMDGLGVFEETAPLKKVLMWGTPGAECALAQLLPENISCFYEQFNVMGARVEFNNAVSLLKKVSPSTEVILVKDLYSQMIKKEGITSGLNLSSLMNKFEQRAKDLYETYKLGDLDQVLSWINTSVMIDVADYGEEAAIVMNETLANFEGLPMANILYARDQSNLIGKTLVLSSMKHEIRQPEVALYKKIFDASGIFGKNIAQIQVNGSGRFEGGDGIVSDGIAYIGVGGRTNLEGVMQVASYILKDGLRIIVVYDKRRDEGIDGEMEAMHYDTIGMPVSMCELVACPEELDRREAFELVIGSGGDLVVLKLGSFNDFLKRQEIEVLPVTKEEQTRHAPNFVNVGDKKILLSLANKNLVKKLQDRNYHSFYANLNQITKGYGGLHCMSAPIKRG